MQKKLKLYLYPKPIGSGYGFMKKVDVKTCEVPTTTAILVIDSVSPETSTDFLLKWLKDAPKTVAQWTPYNLIVREEK